MGCRHCLPLTVVQLKGKHCQKNHCRNGVVDKFGPGQPLGSLKGAYSHTVIRTERLFSLVHNVFRLLEIQKSGSAFVHMNQVICTAVTPVFSLLWLRPWGESFIGRAFWFLRTCVFTRYVLPSSEHSISWNGACRDLLKIYYLGYRTLVCAT